MPQNVAVFEELTVRENIDYFCALYVNDRAKRRDLVDEAIAFVGLEDYEKFRPRKLSGGLLRRLNIACGIAHKPELIFFDEPTVAVDPQSRNAILEGIQNMNRQGSTVVYTSHYMEEVEHLCDRVIILDKGKIIAAGSVDKLKQLSDLEERVTLQGCELPEDMREDPQIESVEQRGKTVTLVFRRGENNLAGLVAELARRGVRYESIYSERPTLNDVFLQLTGKELRD